ncbi:hypothetical protein [uncultured Winogradskyella sp.]|uniref:hypothetical protein n=1 Tax=uncultured Winogradskyella sp. TaxID=395353 RepID=UPI00261D140B|nr:hypothetical protein [uncultured Winogradskyella sp.]
MLKKIIFTVLFLIVSFCATAQKDIHNYKYIIVPKKFDFSNSEDEYQLNSLTKFLFNKYGFEAYFVDDDLPEDLQKDRCLALTSEIFKQKGGMFKTKLEFKLKDCFGSVIMISQIGESRLKEYDKAYNEALRDAFVTFQNLDYEYAPMKDSVEVSGVKDKIEEPKVEEVKEPEVETKVKDKKQEVKKINIKEDSKGLYYAQIIVDGYQLVDSEPKVIMILFNTSAKDVFIVKDKNAIVYKEGDLWIYYEHNDNKKIRKELDIKF